MNLQEIPISGIEVVENHRVDIQKTAINELMLSIKQHGLQQPIGVSKVGKKYHLIFGQRRFLACQKLGWKTITAAVGNDVTEKDMSILCLTENIQRVNPSFEELGRGIEQLQKMDMTIQEIAARLGIDEKKANNILQTYTSLPKKHREKVKFMGRGARAKGCVSPQIANKILRIKKHRGLTDKACDSLFQYVIDTDMSKEDLDNLAILLNEGLELKDALEKLCSYHVYHIDIVADRLEVGKLIQDNQLAGNKQLFRRIIFGKMAPLKKPSFINI